MDNTLTEANSNRDMVQIDGPVEETALVPTSMLKDLKRIMVGLIGTIENPTDELATTNPPIVDSIQLPNSILIHSLRPREFEVLTWMAMGLSNSAIAQRLAISRKTVENKINQIYQTLLLVHLDHVDQRVQAVLYYKEACKSSRQ